ncbi:MAG: hypothetical protein HS126_18850 [Anaerolineales bacterium]|nr:hypothetical protein [Anaerolineales bacterium]
MNQQHTPGPWYWTREKIGDEWHCFLRGQPNHLNDTLVTAMRPDLAAFPYATETPNARLIAAAPDLLAALEAMMNYHHGGSLETASVNDRIKEINRMAQAAIARAKGEPQC